MEDVMQKIDENYIIVGLIWLIAGMAFGIWMGINQKFGYAESHAHANLVGFVASVLFGLIYRAFPSMKISRLAAAQFWIYTLGAAILVAGKVIYDTNGSETVVKGGSIVIVLGALLMLWVFVTSPRPSA
jgi:cbb3-type cytochrome oxidase subunit 1